jgi:hypothetical protein
VLTPIIPFWLNGKRKKIGAALAGGTGMSVYILLKVKLVFNTLLVNSINK